MNFIKWQQKSLFVLIFLTGSWLSGCASDSNIGVGVMDNAVQQYAQGMMAIEDGKLDQAGKKFDRALALVKKFSPALAGKSLLVAHEADRQEQADHRAVDVARAIELLDAAEDSADAPHELFIYHVTAIRVLTILKTKKWLQMSTAHHKFALDIDDLDSAKLPYYKNQVAADYFMAVAKYNSDFRKAEPLLQSVVGSVNGGKWIKKANKLYEKIHKIARASSYHTMSGVALKIAVLDEVSRGDVAALMVSELKLDALFAGRIRKRSQEKEAQFTPADVLDHPFREEIATVMKWNIRGLAPIYDSQTRAELFKPNEIVSRRDLALMLEDVLVQVTGQADLASQFIGQKSPIPDVAATVGWFNAVMTVTTRGLMKSEVSGEFRPSDPVSGADLLLAIMTLRTAVNGN
ncbi:MAG: S-layer homology domain-containing protein [Magnetococcales bacterium]|nr:S-layer homology domain-containing protein [Magnetococcales bacterium]